MFRSKFAKFLLSWPTDTEYLRWIFPDSMKRTVFRICYNKVGQRMSICDYWNGKKGQASSPKNVLWNLVMFRDMLQCFDQSGFLFPTDPHQRTRYLQGNTFLPLLNGDRTHSKIKGMKWMTLNGDEVSALSDGQKILHHTFFFISPPQNGGETFWASRSLFWLEDQTMASSHHGSQGLFTTHLHPFYFQIRK